jgi:3-deoxy-D-manno-octulosonic-acid transferase
MRWVVDALYVLGVVLLSPLWLGRMIRKGTLRTNWAERLGRVPPLPEYAARPTLLIHAVSVGEVNAIRLLVDHLSARPSPPRIVISTTTDTGLARARALFGSRHPVVRYPLDFSWSVARFLRTTRPDAVALVELELWPNFTRACAARGVPVVVINGRLSERSAARYRRVAWLVRPSFRRLTFAAVQTDAYAQRFRELGVPRDRVKVTGTMKWDTAEIADGVSGSDALAEAMGIDRHRPLVVAGSTAPGEPELLVKAVPDGAQLLCAPRRPEWFDGAAAALPGCVRRSRGDRGSSTGRFLLDTIGELRLAYALADLVVVGRSFVPLHGSDMMEPVALGKATIVGPCVADFTDTCDALLGGGGILQVQPADLATTLRSLLDDPARRHAMAAAGRQVIRAHQGATARHAAMLIGLLDAGTRGGPPRDPARP